MLKSLYTSATGMKAQQVFVDTISNNLANVNTTGFKRNTVNFQDLLYVTLKQPGIDKVGGRPSPMGLQLGSGCNLVGSPKIHSQGNLKNTQNPLDIAIEGDGFLQVTLQDGSTGYTRDGSLKIDNTGNLVTAEGHLVVPNITIPQDAITVSISKVGEVSVTTASSPETPSVQGNLQLARFVNPAGLSSLGANLYRETPASGTPAAETPGTNGMGTLLQNYLEHSNVEVVNELVDLIVAQRAYEVNSRSIRTSDKMLGQVNNIIN